VPRCRRTGAGAGRRGGRHPAGTRLTVAQRYLAAALRGPRHARFATDGNTSNTESH